ncbi:hypothetical protein RR42_s1103 [Cupriavidus basilensis]|uniref:Uncharacterized protein n=1 Tax=Cupriavidus basilensis TaxID=68895 RepID=A0A0C4YAZ7_9BURK|nr:hypothetical protein RR42_s1103 [Cupriavidus basilensis]
MAWAALAGRTRFSRVVAGCRSIAIATMQCISTSFGTTIQYRIHISDGAN